MRNTFSAWVHSWLCAWQAAPGVWPALGKQPSRLLLPLGVKGQSLQWQDCSPPSSDQGREDETGRLYRTSRRRPLPAHELSLLKTSKQNQDSRKTGQSSGWSCTRKVKKILRSVFPAPVGPAPRDAVLSPDMGSWASTRWGYPGHEIPGQAGLSTQQQLPAQRNMVQRLQHNAARVTPTSAQSRGPSAGGQRPTSPALLPALLQGAC